MKKTYWMLGIIGVLVIIGVFMIFRPGGEDSWIKDEKGVWIKHGFPAETPDYVKEQQEIIECASGLYEQVKTQGIQFSSQCLGTCGDYVVDVVHVPRSDEDNLVENQCEDYRSGEIEHFIELDGNGNLYRIV